MNWPQLHRKPQRECDDDTIGPGKPDFEVRRWERVTIIPPGSVVWRRRSSLFGSLSWLAASGVERRDATDSFYNLLARHVEIH